MRTEKSDESFEQECNQVVRKVLKAVNKNRVDVIISSLTLVWAKFCLDIARGDKEKALEFSQIYCDAMKEIINDGDIKDFLDSKIVSEYE